MILSDKNFVLFAAQNYINYNCDDMEEFYEDLNRIKVIKKMLNKYSKNNELNLNLVLNHIIILYNVFEAKACTKLLFFKLSEYKPILKSILYHLNYLPDIIYNLEPIVITEEINFDMYIQNKLRNILNVDKHDI